MWSFLIWSSYTKGFPDVILDRKCLIIQVSVVTILGIISMVFFMAVFWMKNTQIVRKISSILVLLASIASVLLMLFTKLMSRQGSYHFMVNNVAITTKLIGDKPGFDGFESFKKCDDDPLELFLGCLQGKFKCLGLKMIFAMSTNWSHCTFRFTGCFSKFIDRNRECTF